MHEYFLELRFYFSWVVTSAVDTGNFYAKLQDFCLFEAMRKSEHVYQVAFIANIIILIYFNSSTGNKASLLDMSTSQVWISCSIYLNLSNTCSKKHWSFNTVYTSQAKKNRKKKKKLSALHFYSKLRKSDFNIKQTRKLTARDLSPVCKETVSLKVTYQGACLMRLPTLISTDTHVCLLLHRLTTFISKLKKN